MSLLEAYLNAGGMVISCAKDAPSLVDGQVSPRGRTASLSATWNSAGPAQLPRLLLQALQADGDFDIRIHRGQGGILLHHRRQLKDGQLLFLTNTSIELPVSGFVKSRLKSVEEWRLFGTPAFSPYPFEKTEQGITANFELPPCGSLLLFVSNKHTGQYTPRPVTTTFLKPAGPTIIQRAALNVLTMDFLDVTAGGESIKNAYWYNAAKFAFQKHGMQANPWDHTVQFRDEIISKKFAPDSGFAATYRFIIEGPVPGLLYVVIERPDLYQITCNGKKVVAKEGSWWLDRSFGKIDISSAAKTGENAVTIKAHSLSFTNFLQRICWVVSR
jgi:hypothetical protein